MLSETCRSGPGGRLEFLDGLRGWAALAVLFSHTFQMFLFAAATTGTGHEVLVTVMTETPLGLLLDGAQAVFLFFVLSGFALSLPVLSTRKVLTTLTRMALFRYFRLTVPILASCLLAQTLWSAGAFRNAAAGVAAGSAWLSSFYRFDPAVADLLRFSLFDVYFGYDESHSWNAVLWTMPVELVGSFALFALLAVPSRALQVGTAAVACLFLLDSRYFGFPCGFLIAVVFLSGRRLGRAQTLASLLMMDVAIGAATFLRSPLAASLPASIPPPYVPIRNAIAALFIAGVALSPVIRACFSGPLSRFLGQISFPLYLVHLPIICSLSASLYLTLLPGLPFWPLTTLVGAVTVGASVAASVLFGMIVEGRTLRLTKSLVSLLTAEAFGTSPRGPGVEAAAGLTTVTIPARPLPIAASHLRRETHERDL